MFLTIEELGWILRLSERTIRQRIKNGDIKAHTFGRSVRIPIDQFSNILDTAKLKAEVEKRAELLKLR